MQIKRCPGCGHINKISSDECEVCKKNIILIPHEFVDDEESIIAGTSASTNASTSADTGINTNTNADVESNESTNRKMFARCPGCGTYIEIERLGVSVRCLEPSCLKKFSPIEENQIVYASINDGTDEIEENKLDNAVDTEKSGSVQLFGEGIKQIILTNLQDHKSIKIPIGKYVVGAKGEIEQGYFQQFPYISSQHMIVEVSAEEVFFTDISKNHTYFNSRTRENRFPFNQKQEIKDGNIIVMANEVFEVKFCR